jgi:hypothetical protein
LVVPYGAGAPGRGPYHAGVSAGAARVQLTGNQMRAFRYPGLITPERGAVGWIPVPDPATITDDSTLTLEDGINTRVFEFDNDASGLTVGSDVLVDIQGLASAAAFGVALQAAILADAQLGNLLLSPTLKNRGGVIYIGLKQQAPITPPIRIPGWVQLTGLFATGNRNPPIVASIPAEWPNLPASLLGGKGTLPGLFYVPVLQAAQIRLLPEGLFEKGIPHSETLVA